MSHSLEYMPSEAELVRAFRLLGRRKGRRKVLPALWLGIALCVILLAVLIGSMDRLFSSPLLTAMAGAAAILFACLFALLLAAPALRRRAARATLAQNPNFEAPATLELDEDAFRHRARYASAAYPWDKLYGWRADGEVVVVQPTPQQFYVVPRRVLDVTSTAVLEDGLARSRQGRLDV